jgi:WD40 repeat protein
VSESSTAQPAAAAAAATALEFRATEVVKTAKYSSPLIGCRFDPQGKRVVTAAQDCCIQVWDGASDTPAVLTGHESWLRALGFSPDGATLYSAGYDGALLFWNLAEANPQPVRRIAAHDGWVRWLSVSPDGQWLATGGNDRLVKLWSAATGELVQSLAGHEAHVYSTLFHPSENWLLSGDLLGKVHQWDFASGKLVRSLSAEDLHSFNGGQGAHYGGVRSMSFSADAQQLACSGLHKASNPFGAVQEPLVVVLKWESGDKLRGHLADGLDRGIAWRSVYHPAGTLIGISGGGSGGFILFWQADSEKAVHQFKLPNTALDMDMSPLINQVATAHHDGHLRISALK